MKILELISGTNINGAVVYSNQLIQHLAARGHQVTVVCRGRGWLWDQLRDTEVRLVASEMQRWPMTELKRIAGLIREQQIDVVHTHMSRAHTFGILLKWLTCVPVVATAHNRYLQLHWALNDRVIANSDATRTFHCRVNRVHPNKISTVHCFVNLESFRTISPRQRRATRRQLGIKDDHPLLGVVGEVIPRKGQIYLIQALPQLIRHFPDLKLIIVGRYNRKEAYTRKLRRQIHQLGLFGRTIWVGRTTEVPNYIAAMDACVVPSVEEPLGLVPIEAMAAGTPVVVSDSGGLPEIVDDQRTGLIVRRKNPTELAQAIRRILSDFNLRERLTRSARDFVYERFAPEDLVDQVEDQLRLTAAIRKAA